MASASSRTSRSRDHVAQDTPIRHCRRWSTPRSSDDAAAGRATAASKSRRRTQRTGSANWSTAPSGCRRVVEDFKPQPAVLRRRARRDQLHPALSRRAPKHISICRHYLDIRGLENSVNRSRHNQSYRPVLERRSRRARGGATLMVSLADVGVLTVSRVSRGAQLMWADAVGKKMYSRAESARPAARVLGAVFAAEHLGLARHARC